MKENASAAKPGKAAVAGDGQDGLTEDVKYIDILVEITLNFIRAEYPDKG